MIHATADDWACAPAKRILLFGMSGLGKTHVSAMLRDAGWFHYSVDYRIGTRYMGEHIADAFKAEAMKVPSLAALLRSDSIFIGSNITFDNLAPLSSYLGKPGNPALGGLPFEEYRRRQAQHRQAEIAALLDCAHFIDRARRLYGYADFVCDSSGSLCEVVDPDDPADPVMTALSQVMLPVWIEGTEAHTQALVRRFDRAPKPMYYRPDFLSEAWTRYLAEAGLTAERVDPDAFVRWTYARALAQRQPLYRAIAQRWGVSVAAGEIAEVDGPEALVALVGRAITARG